MLMTSLICASLHARSLAMCHSLSPATKACSNELTPSMRLMALQSGGHPISSFSWMNCDDNRSISQFDWPVQQSRYDVYRVKSRAVYTSIIMDPEIRLLRK